MSMISNALITGGDFSQNIDQRLQVYAQTQKGAIDRLQEAVAPSSFHNSGERFDPPKCHPNTRVAVLDKIEKWALRMDPDTNGASILWLSGAAGAGKSAIAQTLAEHFHSMGLLIASFFFGRSDSTRNHARSLVSTIVYQLYSSLPPLEQSRILDVIDRDPLIFTKSLRAQFEALVVNPLQPIFENGLPRLIIIDGLDECLDRGMQRNVLLMISASVRQFHLPFIFLLASRPEHDIQAIFGTPDFLPIHTRLFLDDTYLPDIDIELFLRDEFEECRTTHPFKETIPPDWPSDDIVQKITSKSSGQFIYASVVAKYIKSSRHRPHHRLEVVLNLRPASRDLPFAEIDALYTRILSGVHDVERTLDVISFHIAFPYIPVFHIERILGLDAGEVAILLCDLASVVGCEEDPAHEVWMKIHHASLTDYLLDSARSKEYFISATKGCADHVANCFQFLSRYHSQNPAVFTGILAMRCFKNNSHSLDLTEPLYNAISGFSISRIQNAVLAFSHEIFLEEFTFRFLPALFKFLKKSDSEKHLELYQHHQSEYDLFLRQQIGACSPETPVPLVLALITNYYELPQGAFHDGFALFDRTHFGDRASAALQLGTIESTHMDYVEYLSNFMHDPERSREFCAGPKLFAQAAKYCLLYLCDHAAFSQKIPPRMSAQQRMRRKNTPWKWHRRVLRGDIRGSRVTPWLWLRRPTSYGSVSRTRVLHRTTNDLIYIHSPYFVMLFSPEYDDPVVKYRVDSEKYYLALVYLNHFLPRAAQLDDLVHMCRRLTFASLSQHFPRESARARSHMRKYTAQWVLDLREQTEQARSARGPAIALGIRIFLILSTFILSSFILYVYFAV